MLDALAQPRKRGRQILAQRAIDEELRDPESWAATYARIRD
jgi:predicted transcriptional regulator